MPLKYTRSRAPSTTEDGLGDAPVISNDTLRKKAKYRLIGSIVLVLLGVLGFTLMLDTQPRPNTTDVTVLIPARDKLPPLALTAPASAALVSSAPAVAVPPASAPVTQAAAASAAAGSAPLVSVAASLAPQEVIVSRPLASKAAASAALASASQAQSNANQAKKADATADTAADKGRYILQVGAFAEVQKAREARMKLEHAGIKTYTQVIQNPEGRRIRVRVGPFDKRADAEKVAAKIRALDLPAALLTL